MSLVSKILTSVLLKECGSNQATIQDLILSPQNPLAGEMVNLTVAYDLKSPITSGQVKYTYKYNGLPFSPTIEDLCTQTECPKLPGYHVEESISEWPAISGSLVSQIQWYNQNNELVWCVEMNVGKSYEVESSDSGSTSSSDTSSSSTSGSDSSSSSSAFRQNQETIILEFIDFYISAAKQQIHAYYRRQNDEL